MKQDAESKSENISFGKVIIYVALLLSALLLFIVSFVCLLMVFKAGQVAVYTSFLLTLIGLCLAWIAKKIEWHEARGFAGIAIFLGFVALVFPFYCNIHSVVEKEAAKKYIADYKGESLKEAEKRYFKKNGTYSQNLDELLKINPSLDDAPGITFVFLHASESVFSFYSDNCRYPGKYYFSNH